MDKRTVGTKQYNNNIVYYCSPDRLIKQQINLDNNPSCVATPHHLQLDQNIIIFVDMVCMNQF